MGGFIKRDVQRNATYACNNEINKELFDSFRDRCKIMGYPMNVVVEIFMQQYANRRICVEAERVSKWRNDNSVTDTFNTTINKEIYLAFKQAVKEDHYFIKYVISAFMELFVEEQYFLEYISTEKAESETLNAVDINYEEIQNEPNGEDEGSIVPTVGLMKCPFCGCEREATSDNWMLIQFPDSTTKYLTCRECGGQNE